MPNPFQAEHDALPRGTRLGEFEIEGVLGAGGFGIVYRALDHALQRRVAIKEYMPAALAGRAGGVRLSLRSAAHQETFELGLRSFINEARLLARFDHPSLVKVYRFWEENGTAYMVMPCYQGQTLREARLQMKGPVAEPWLLSLLQPLLGALACLHAQQVYHRDVAPDNVLLLDSPVGTGEPTLTCSPMLLDFGAARHVIGDHTQTLTAILKPSFAPVEQYGEGSTLRQGPWTDLYALAAVAYFCITGRAPLAAPARAVHDELPALAAMAPALERDFGCRYRPGVLEAIDHALAVRPQHRPQSVAEWVAELGLEHAAAPLEADNAAAPARTVRLGGEAWPATQVDATTVPLVHAPGPDLFIEAAAAATATATAPSSAPALAQAPGAAQVQPGETRRGSTGLWVLTGVLVVAMALLGWRLGRGGWGGDAAESALQPSPSAARQQPVADRETAASAAAKTRVARVAKVADRGAGRVDAPPQPPAAGPRAAEPAPQTPRQQCGKRVFIALAVCMNRVCEQPDWARHPQCVRWRELEEANRPRQP